MQTCDICGTAYQSRMPGDRIRLAPVALDGITFVPFLSFRVLTRTGAPLRSTGLCPQCKQKVAEQVEIRTSSNAESCDLGNKAVRSG